jgi:hypothetical protein
LPPPSPPVGAAEVVAATDGVVGGDAELVTGVIAGVAEGAADEVGPLGMVVLSAEALLPPHAAANGATPIAAAANTAAERR